MSIAKYATTGEQKVARALVDRILKDGYSISVYDGEEWTVRHSTNSLTILAEMATTDTNTIRVGNPEALQPNGKPSRVGWFTLIWGNDPSGEELIADYADNLITGIIAQAVHAQFFRD